MFDLDADNFELKYDAEGVDEQPGIILLSCYNAILPTEDRTKVNVPTLKTIKARYHCTR